MARTQRRRELLAMDMVQFLAELVADTLGWFELVHQASDRPAYSHRIEPPGPRVERTHAEATVQGAWLGRART